MGAKYEERLVDELMWLNTDYDGVMCGWYRDMISATFFAKIPLLSLRRV